MWKGSGGRKKNWREAEKVWCSPNKGLSQLQGKLQSQMTFQELNQVGQRDQALIRTWQQVLDTDHPERGGMTWDNVARSKANSWKKLIAGGCLPVVFPALGGRKMAIRPERRSERYITATSSWHSMTLTIFMTYYISFRAAKTKHHRLGIWNNGDVFFF